MWGHRCGAPDELDVDLRLLVTTDNTVDTLMLQKYITLSVWDRHYMTFEKQGGKSALDVNRLSRLSSNERNDVEIHQLILLNLRWDLAFQSSANIVF